MQKRAHLSACHQTSIVCISQGLASLMCSPDLRAMHPDDKVLSLGDVLLRRSDVELLAGPHWLNDQV
jgi:hypothetical protein